MVKLSVDIPGELARQIDRIIRDGWFPDQERVVQEALLRFVDSRSFLGDSPRLLHGFAADALNESKPDTALKFVSRALSLLDNQEVLDQSLYQSLVELQVQILLVGGRNDEAVAALESARDRMPNNPTIARWLERLNRKQ